jgi:HK97 family phage prohead protease
MTKQPQRSEFDLFRRQASIVRLAPPAPDAPGDVLTVDVVWGSEYAVSRTAYDWTAGTYVEFEEVIPFTPEACDMTRLKSGNAPVLDSHADYYSDNVVGVVRSAEIREKQGFATLAISNAPGLEDFRAKVREGTLKNISVGYSVSEWTIEEKQGQPTRWTATKWEPMEISFVPIPADPNAAVIGDAARKSRRFQCSLTRAANGKDSNMPPKEAAAAGNEPGNADNNETADNVVAIETARAAAALEGRKVEAARQGEVREIVRDFGFEPADAEPFLANHEADGNFVRKALQAKIAERQAAARARQPGQTVTEGFDLRRKRVALVGNALEHMVNPRTALEDDARPYRGLRLSELARAYLAEEGFDVRGLGRMDIATLALKGSLPFELQSRAAGMHSTSDFPLILANAVTKRLRDAYNQAPSLWKSFSRQSNAPDFKSKYVVLLSEAPRFQKVYEGGEYKYGKLSEDGTNYAIATYGVIVAITRQAIINDDLGAFDRIPSLYGRAAMDNESDIVWALITANPTMSDGNALFSSAHGNLTGTGTAISITSLGVARALFRAQKNIGALEYLNLTPKFLVVPPELETIALQFVLTQVAPVAATNVNPFAGTLDLIVEPRLSANSTTAWYLIADPAQIDVIEFGYLEGQQGLYTETRNGFEVDGIEIKARDDFGAQVIDWRGLYKNAGA